MVYFRQFNEEELMAQARKKVAEDIAKYKQKYTEYFDEDK